MKVSDMLRYMRTTAERRYIAAQESDRKTTEIHVPVRAKRKNIPHCWDDRWRTLQRSWKEHRLTHYRKPQPDFKQLNSGEFK